MTPMPALAGRLERFLANLVDTVAIFMFTTLVLTALRLPVESGPGMLGTFLFNAAYFSWFTASDWQASPGQRLFGIVVARLDGQRVGMRAAIERFLAYFMPSMPMYLSIASPETLAKVVIWLVIVWFSPILWRADRRAVHDLLCGTVVLTGKR